MLFNLSKSPTISLHPSNSCIFITCLIISGVPWSTLAATTQGKDGKNLRPASLRTFPGTSTLIPEFLGQLQLSNSLWTLFIPWFQMFMAKLNSAFRRSAISVTDKRVQTMNEFLTCIKLIKMYAWEKSFTNTIQGRMCRCLKNYLPCRMCSSKGLLRFLGPGIAERGLWGFPELLCRLFKGLQRF